MSSLPWRFEPVDDDNDLYVENTKRKTSTAQTPSRDSRKRGYAFDDVDDTDKSIPYQQVLEKRRRADEVEAALNALLTPKKPDILTDASGAAASSSSSESSTSTSSTKKKRPIDELLSTSTDTNNSKKSKAASKKRTAADATVEDADDDGEEYRRLKKVPILTDKDGFAIPKPRAPTESKKTNADRKKQSAADATFGDDDEDNPVLRARAARAKLEAKGAAIEAELDAKAEAADASKARKASTAQRKRTRDDDVAAAESVHSRFGGRLRQPNTLSHDAFFRHQVRSDAEEQGERMRRTRVHEKWEHSSMADTSQSECVGDRRMRFMKEALEFLGKNGFDWSKTQRVMHMAWLACSNGQYYGEELRQHLVRLLREQGWSEQRSECVVLAPRRNGKTIAVSGFAAAEIVTQPGTPGSERGHDVLVYSNNMRASKMLLLQTYKMVKILQTKFGGYVKSLNKNESMVYITAEGYENEMCAYPAKPENLRGTGSKAPTGTVIAEEFAYMPLEVVFSIIGPTLTRKNVKFIGITTVSGQDSFVTPLVDAKYPDGRSVMLTLNFELVCADCKKAGKAHLCKCLMGDIPPWQSTVQHGKLSILMEQHMETYMKELKGFAIDETISPAFCQISVDFLNTPEAVMPTSELYSERVYTAVDPACGGKYSKYAIVSVIWIDGKMVVVGADSCTSNRPEDQKAKLVEHIRRVRTIRGLETAKIIFAPESNLGLEGKRIAAELAVAKVPECYCLVEDTKGGEGIRMTNELKKEMWLSFNALLLNRQIRWHPNMVSLSDDEGFSPEGMRKMIIGELANYKRMLVYSKTDPYADPKEIFTGKVGGTKDDHCIAIQLAFKSMEFWHANAEFYKYHKALWTPTHT